MENSSNRWITSIFLLAMFGVIALAGTRSVKTAAQGSSNVVVTNTASQAVPVSVPARPPTVGAYVVSVVNSPPVNVVNTVARPVLTKNINTYSDAFEVDLSPDIANGHYYGTGHYTVPSGKRFVIESISCYSFADSANGGALMAIVANDVTGGEILVPVSSLTATISTGVQNVLLVAGAGQGLTVYAERDESNLSGTATCGLILSGHLVSYP